MHRCWYLLHHLRRLCCSVRCKVRRALIRWVCCVRWGSWCGGLMLHGGSLRYCVGRTVHWSLVGWARRVWRWGSRLGRLRRMRGLSVAIGQCVGRTGTLDGIRLALSSRVVGLAFVYNMRLCVLRCSMLRSRHSRSLLGCSLHLTGACIGILLRVVWPRCLGLGLRQCRIGHAFQSPQWLMSFKPVIQLLSHKKAPYLYPRRSILPQLPHLLHRHMPPVNVRRRPPPRAVGIHAAGDVGGKVLHGNARRCRAVH
mmetsp:Transcript_12019/g.29426  ORF Transcript_12019/g.29426 Transcript_12019/m.29426 type:complete len:254 (+) Transcript_12019:974-1735(+)